jgi:hypothetical protein
MRLSNQAKVAELVQSLLSAEILPVCLGGSRRSISFYCRGANASSFDPDKPL